MSLSPFVRRLSLFFIVIGILFAAVLSSRSSLNLSLELVLSKALVWAGAYLGRAEEQYSMGDVFDPDRAFMWYEKAAKQGHVEAKIRLAFAYENGIGAKENKAHAMSIYLPLAVEGDTYAQTAVCQIYKDKAFPARDYKEAFYWCSKAAEQGFPTAVYQLSTFYFFGYGKKANFHKGAELLLRAQALNSSIAVRFIERLKAYCFAEESTEIATKADSCRVLAAINNTQAQLIAGKYYLDGTYFERDNVEAYTWLSLAREGRDVKDISGEEVADYNLLISKLSAEEKAAAEKKIQLYSRMYKQ